METIKGYDDLPKTETRWGSYSVILNKVGENNCTKVKILQIKEGKNISYQKHRHRSEGWLVLKGVGVFILEGKRKMITKGHYLEVAPGQLHTVKAITDLVILETQQGSICEEEDIQRIEYDWNKILEKAE